MVLLDPERTIRPGWYPLRHFLMINRRMAAGWEVSIRPAGDWQIIIGYSLLTTSVDHFDGILERDPASLQEFVRMKIAAENAALNEFDDLSPT
jgi:hypothetical protein